MINLASRDILLSWGKFLFTGIGLGLLIGVTLMMAGVYRGMVADGEALLDNSGADLWVVQQGTLGPYAEPSGLSGDLWRSIRILPDVEEAVNATYLTMQVSNGVDETRAMVSGITAGSPGTPGWPTHLIAGRQIVLSHYEAIVDEATNFKIGDELSIRRNRYRVVGMTRRMVSSNGDPMIFIPLKDASQAQFLKDNEAILMQRRRNRADERFNRPGQEEILEAIDASQTKNDQVNAILVRLTPNADSNKIVESIERWLRLTAYDRNDMKGIMIDKLIATSAMQIGMFLIILATVCAAIVAFIIYTLTIDKIREIAVLKLLGTPNRTIASMILQQSLILGLIGFVVGRIGATFAAPHFPKYILLIPLDSVRGLFFTLLICTLASIAAIRIALKVDPAEAIG